MSATPPTLQKDTTPEPEPTPNWRIHLIGCSECTEGNFCEEAATHLLAPSFTTCRGVPELVLAVATLKDFAASLRSSLSESRRPAPEMLVRDNLPLIVTALRYVSEERLVDLYNSDHFTEASIDAYNGIRTAAKALADAIAAASDSQPSAPEKLAAFGAWALHEARSEWGDLSGSAMEDKATELGVLVATPVTEPCGETCACVKYLNIPGDCYRYADDVKAYLAARAETAK